MVYEVWKVSYCLITNVTRKPDLVTGYRLWVTGYRFQALFFRALAIRALGAALTAVIAHRAITLASVVFAQGHLALAAFGVFHTLILALG